MMYIFLPPFPPSSPSLLPSLSPSLTRYPEYVLQHISNLPGEEPQRSLKAAILLYSSFLMTMFTTKSKTFEQEGVYTTNVNQYFTTCNLPSSPKLFQDFF